MRAGLSWLLDIYGSMGNSFAYNSHLVLGTEPAPTGLRAQLKNSYLHPSLLTETVLPAPTILLANSGSLRLQGLKARYARLGKGRSCKPIIDPGDVDCSSSEDVLQMSLCQTSIACFPQPESTYTLRNGL